MPWGGGALVLASIGVLSTLEATNFLGDVDDFLTVFANLFRLKFFSIFAKTLAKVFLTEVDNSLREVRDFLEFWPCLILPTPMEDLPTSTLGCSPGPGS